MKVREDMNYQWGQRVTVGCAKGIRKQEKRSKKGNTASKIGGLVEVIKVVEKDGGRGDKVACTACLKPWREELDRTASGMRFQRQKQGQRS